MRSRLAPQTLSEHQQPQAQYRAKLAIIRKFQEIERQSQKAESSCHHHDHLKETPIRGLILIEVAVSYN